MILVRGGWVAGSYSDIKTNLSQVGLDWDWPTGLSLAISVQDTPTYPPTLRTIIIDTCYTCKTY